MLTSIWKAYQKLFGLILITMFGIDKITDVIGLPSGAHVKGDVFPISPFPKRVSLGLFMERWLSNPKLTVTFLRAKLYIWSLSKMTSHYSKRFFALNTNQSHRGIGIEFGYLPYSNFHSEIGTSTATKSTRYSIVPIRLVFKLLSTSLTFTKTPYRFSGLAISVGTDRTTKLSVGFSRESFTTLRACNLYDV